MNFSTYALDHAAAVAPGAGNPDWSSLGFPVDLLPIGVVVMHCRTIVNCNSAFAQMFGYAKEEVIQRSIEMLYPSRLEFLDIGDRWLSVMRDSGGCGDERIMRYRGGEGYWYEVVGRCGDLSNPFELVVCTFQRKSTSSESMSGLTAREREIVWALRDGLTSKEIARQLHLSPRTVESYRARLMQKVGARKATELLTKMLPHNQAQPSAQR